MITLLRISVIGSSLLLFLPCNNLLSQWLKQPFPNSEYLWKVRFIDAATGWIMGGQFLYKTTDEGASWISQDSSMGAGLALCALDRNVAFYATYTGVPPYTRGIRRTTDGGASWETVDTATLYYTRIEFIDSQTGFAVGGRLSGGSDFNPIVRRSTDAGSTWATVWIGTGVYEVTGISFTDPRNGWVVTYDAYLYHTSDGGLTWVFKDSVVKGAPGSRLPVRDIEFVTSDSAWAVGGIGGEVLIASSTNGGVTWSDTGRPGPSVTEVQFVSSHEGWMIGEFGEPWHTINGGASWEQQISNPQFSTFESISMVNANLGWAVGANGNVYRTLGPTTVSDGHLVNPIEFGLDQNYPNPFNPETGIRFQVSGVSEVRLSVFDILGREVAVLVNERKLPGSYEVKFDGSSLSSEVYFYRLIAGKYVECRKMVLMK